MAINFLTDPVGTRYGCKYTYTGSTFGTFSGLSSAPTDGRRVKDPLNISGSYFIAVEPPDLGILNITDIIQLKTKRVFKSNESVLMNGSEFVTKDEIDINNYKHVASFSPSPTPVLAGIPKDQLFVTKEPIGTSDFATGINKITMTVNNMNVKVALSKDNKNWVTYNSSTNTWDEVILNTKYMEQLKTKMMDYTVLNGLTQDKYDMYFGAPKQIGIAVLCYIDGTDTTKTYSISSMVLDYVGDQDDKTPTVQYMNFIKAGYRPNGDIILLADRTVQQGISYKQLFDANLTNFTKLCELSTPEFQMYYGLPRSSSYDDGSEDEWHALLDPSYTGGKELYDFYNTAIASFTQTIAIDKDDEGRGGGASKVICRGSGSAMGFNNVESTGTEKWYGWRPMLIIDRHTPVAKHALPVLPVAKDIADITKGKCISCDYVVTSPTAMGTLENLGNAQLGLLSDYTNTTSGSFYFVCVGYTRDKGYPILVADRNIHTGLAFSAVSKVGDGSNACESGITTAFDLTRYNVRLAGALAHVDTDYEDEDAINEWDAFIVNGLNDCSQASVFHDDKTVSWTRTLYEDTTDVVVRGMTKHQRHLPSQTTVGMEEVGYRPILILEPKISITNLLVTPYVGYKVHKAASQFKCEITIVDSNNEPVEYWLELKKDGTVLSPKSKDTTRIISVDMLPENVASTVSIVYSTGTDPDSGQEVTDTLYEFDVYRDKEYRLTTTRSFGKYYGGFEGDGATPFASEAKPTTSKQAKIKTNEHGRYIDVSNFASKIIF